MAKVAFNHDKETPMEACGLNEAELSAKYEKFAESINQNQGTAVSAMVEALEKDFSKREIAFIAVQKILSEAELQNFMSNPRRIGGGNLGDLLELLGKAK